MRVLREGTHGGRRYRIGFDDPYPGVRWFLEEPSNDFRGVWWACSSGGFYGSSAEDDAESAIRRKIDREAQEASS